MLKIKKKNKVFDFKYKFIGKIEVKKLLEILSKGENK